MNLDIARGGIEIFSALMYKCGVSPDEAMQIYDEVSTRGSERLEERYIIVDAGMGYQIEVGCLVEVQCMSRYNCGGVIKTWSKTSESGTVGRTTYLRKTISMNQLYK